MKPFDVGKQLYDYPIPVIAATTSKYTTGKISRDHDNFKKVIGKHYVATDKSGRKRPALFKWAKIFTHKNVVHHFSHSHPMAATIAIKRRHVGDGPLYKVHVKIPHPTKEGKFIYNRHTWTKDPSKHLDRMLKEGRWSQANNKQFRRNHHVIASTVLDISNESV